ncbi:MAG: 50S ribosomal protein L3 [Gammaproteobacteria bacterium]|nr:50S ribosomal protein L3 [Gammaproteobacteria bacterium]
MRKALLMRKVGMTQIFLENGTICPVTVLEAQDGNTVLQVKTVENDGYTSYQLGFEDKKERVSTKAEIAHAKKANTAPKRFVKEVRCDEVSVNVGDKVTVDAFAKGEFIDATGTAKGKGYAGLIKLNNQHRGPMAHGSKYHRGIGSLGAIAPNRIYKGMKMPSRMGNWTRTVQNLTVVEVLSDKGVILVKGNVPGPKKGLVFVKAAIKK